MRIAARIKRLEKAKRAGPEGAQDMTELALALGVELEPGERWLVDPRQIALQMVRLAEEEQDVRWQWHS